MKRILLLAIAALWLAAPSSSQAQSLSKLCFPATGLTATRTSCITVDANNPLPTSASVSIGSSINVTPNNTAAAPLFVTNPNGFGGTSVTVNNQTTASAVSVTCTNCGAASVTGPFNVTVTNSSPINVSEVNSAAILAAAQAGTASYGAAQPSSGIAIEALAKSAEPSTVSNSVMIQPMADLTGKLVVSPYANRENFLSCFVSLTNTNTTCTGMSAQGSLVKIYVTDLTCTRNDGGTTAATLAFNDAASTQVDIPNNGGGGGFTHHYGIPLIVAANTAFQISPVNAISTWKCSATGYKGY